MKVIIGDKKCLVNQKKFNGISGHYYTILYLFVVLLNIIRSLKYKPKQTDKLLNYEIIDVAEKSKYFSCEFNLEEVLPMLDSLLKVGGNIIIFNGWSNVVETKTSLDKYFTIRNWIIYDRIKGRGAKTNVVSTREDILWYSKGEKEPYTFNRVMSNIPKKTGGLGKKNGEKNI